MFQYLKRVLGFTSTTELAVSRTATTKILSAIRNNNEIALRQCFWWPLALLMPSKLLRKGEDMMKTMFGPMESFNEPDIHHDGYFRVMKSLVIFQRARFGLTITLWGDKVIGIGIHPPISIGLAPAWEAPEYVDPSSFSEMEITVKFGPFKSAVRGSLTMPTTDRNFPGVLMVPGSGISDRDASLGSNKVFKDIAHGLASAGYAVLRMDKPLKYIALKQFAFRSLTLDDEYVVHNTAALKYLADHPKIATDRIFVLGMSLGGRVAPRICANSSVPIAGMISCAGPSRPMINSLISQLQYSQLHFPRDAGEYDSELTKLKAVEDALIHKMPKAKLADLIKDLPLPLPLSYLQDDFEYDPTETANKLGIPMLFIQGAQDWQVEKDHLDGWKDGLSRFDDTSRSSFRLYEDVGHLLIAFKSNEKGMLQYDEPGHVKTEVIRDILQWMDQITRN